MSEHGPPDVELEDERADFPDPAFDDDVDEDDEQPLDDEDDDGDDEGPAPADD